MVKPAALVAILFLFNCASVSGQGPCSTQSNKLACVLPQEYGTGAAFNQVLAPFGGHPFHFSSDFSDTLKPFTSDIGRQANLLPLASPSSGVIFDQSLASGRKLSGAIGYSSASAISFLILTKSTA
jgi:hypothetical protein